MSDILRVVGQRIGQELALELRNKNDEETFWDHLKLKWRELEWGN